MKTTKRASSKTSKKAAARKTAAKKKTAKKATKKKVAKKKTAKKRTTAKKSATKRTASKRTATTTAAKKRAAKKAAVKKAAKKKVVKKATKKRVVRKAAAKKPTKKGTAEPVEALPYDYDAVVARSRKVLGKREGLTEQKMFGGLCFLLYGNMLGGVSGKHGLMVRVGPDAHADALAQPFARPMDITGRKMRGFVFVDAPGYDKDKALKAWLERGVAFASTLPPKVKKTKA